MPLIVAQKSTLFAYTVLMFVLLRLVLPTLGYLLLIIGLLGLINPFIPDWLLLIPAFAILGRKSRVGRLAYGYLPRAIRRKVFDARLERFFRRLRRRR